MIVRILGIGVRALEHMTLHSMRELRQARKALYFSAAPGEVEWLLDKAGVAEKECVDALYVDGGVDMDNYRRIADRVAAESRRLGDVAFLVHGHPRLGATTVRWLETKEAYRDLTVRVAEGVSSFDTMVNDLRRDPLDRGSLIIDANRMLLYRIALDPHVDHYIYHVCSVATGRTHQSDARRDNRFDLLKAHLLRTFAPDHACELLSSSIVDGDRPLRAGATIGDLESLLPHVHFGTTLFIPGKVPGRESVDEAFLRTVRAATS